MLFSWIFTLGVDISLVDVDFKLNNKVHEMIFKYSYPVRDELGISGCGGNNLKQAIWCN